MTLTVTHPRAEGYGLLLGDEWFRLAITGDAEVRYFTQDSLAQRYDPEGSGGSNVLRIGHAFSRSNLTGGEGLDWWPRQVGESGTERDLIRFWDSANLNLRRPESGEPYQIELSQRILSWWQPTTPATDMGASLDAVYMAVGTNVHRFDDWDDNLPDDTRNLGVTIAALDVAEDDTVVVTDTTGDVWIKPSRSDVYVKCYDATADGATAKMAWWVKGRILVAGLDPSLPAKGTLLEVDPGIGGTLAAPTSINTVTTLDTYTGRVLDVEDAGHAIIAAFDDGTIRSYVPQTDTAGGTPELTIRAQMRVPVNEVPYALGWNSGALLILTYEASETPNEATLRIYSALVLDVRFDYVVGDLQLLRVWRDSNETLPAYNKALVASRDEIWFGIGEGVNEHQVWRYDIVTGGLFRHHQNNNAEIKGLARFQGQLAFIDGTTIFLASATSYAASGYLITPNVTHGLNTPINWTSFVLEVNTLDVTGAYVELFYSIDPGAISDPDHPSWQSVQLYTDIAQSGFEVSLINVQSPQIAVQIKVVASNDGSSSPHVTHFAHRAFPQHRDWVIEAPVNISDWISVPGRRPRRYPGLGDDNHRRLTSLQGASVSCRLLDPPIELRGVVDAVLAPVNYMTPRGSQGRYCIVRFIGNPPNTMDVPGVQGNEGLGIATLGIGTVGIDEVLEFV